MLGKSSLVRLYQPDYIRRISTCSVSTAFTRLTTQVRLNHSSNSNSIGVFDNKLDHFWRNQESYFDYLADLTDIGSQANCNSIMF